MGGSVMSVLISDIEEEIRILQKKSTIDTDELSGIIAILEDAEKNNID